MERESGEMSNASKCLTGELSSGILSPNDTINGKTVYELLKEKQPTPSQVNLNYMVEENTFESIPYHPTIFENTGASAVKKAALKTHGSHGPSGLDANDWRRIFTCFKEVSANIAKTVAKIAILLSTEKLSEKSLEAYNVCRLISLNKNRGVRLIGVGELLRRIIGKCIIKRIENELRFLGGNTQLCLGQKFGIEHAIHSLRSQYETPENEAVLLIDVKNAIKSLNRNLEVENIKRICPVLSFVVQNSYSAP